MKNKKYARRIWWTLYIAVLLLLFYLGDLFDRDSLVFSVLTFWAFVISWIFIGAGYFLRNFGAKFKELAKEKIEQYKISDNE